MKVWRKKYARLVGQEFLLSDSPTGARLKRVRSSSCSSPLTCVRCPLILPAQLPIDTTLVVDESEEGAAEPKPLFAFRINLKQHRPPIVCTLAAELSAERARWLSAFNAAVQAVQAARARILASLTSPFSLPAPGGRTLMASLSGSSVAGSIAAAAAAAGEHASSATPGGPPPQPAAPTHPSPRSDAKLRASTRHPGSEEPEPMQPVVRPAMDKKDMVSRTQLRTSPGDWTQPRIFLSCTPSPPSSHLRLLHRTHMAAKKPRRRNFRVFSKTKIAHRTPSCTQTLECTALSRFLHIHLRSSL